MSDDLKKLVDALQVGYPKENETSLVNGAPLMVEDLDLTGMGLYLEKDPSVPDDDYILAETKIGKWGVGYYMRKSDEGKKWHTFSDKNLKLPKSVK